MMKQAYSLALIELMLLVSPRMPGGSASAQEHDIPFSFEHLTVDDGLSHTTVHALLEDHLGMIWAGTRFGLNRFDGYGFKTFLPGKKDTESIGSQTVLTLWKDDTGNIWAGHRNGGVSVLEYSTGRFRPFPFGPDSTLDWSTTTVRSIFRDSRGFLWFGTYEGGVVVFDPSYNFHARFCSTCEPASRRLSNDFVFDFEEDPMGHIWIGHAGTGISVYDPAADSLHTLFSADAGNMNGFSKSLCSGHGESLWLGTEGSGLYEINWKKREVIRQYEAMEMPGNGLSHRMITDLEPDRAGHLWIATDGGGLNRFSPATGEWLHFRYQPDFLNSLNSDALYDLMFDSAGNLWIGTFNGGINLHKTMFPPFVMNRQYTAERSEGLRSVLCVDQDRQGQVWLGSDGGGLFRLDTDVKPVRLVSLERSAAHPPGIQVITCLVSRPEGGLWLGTFAGGLCLYDEEKGVLQRFQHQPGDPSSLSHNNVWDLAFGPDGSLWIGTLGGGVCHLRNGETSFERYLPEPGNPNSLSGTLVVDVLPDNARQALWVATEDNGLSRIDLSTTPYRITRYLHDPSDTSTISSNKLRCLFRDKEGTVWIGTEYAGLNAFDAATGKFKNYTMEDGLPSDMINSIVQDAQGYLWITTQAGIVRWDKAGGRFIKIGSEPFLRNNQYNAKAALQLSDGRLIFGSTNGYSIVMPDRVLENTIPPRVVFTEFSLSSQAIPVGMFEGRTILSGPLNDRHTVIHLSYLDKGIRFGFTTTDFTQPDKNQFAYRLMGFDTVWRVVGPEQRFATFSALQGGEYELQVKAANSDGIWSAEPGRLTIMVRPPFWQTWWFVASCICAGMLAIGATILVLLQRQKTRYQQQALEAEQEILRLQNESLAKDISGKQSQLSASVLQSAHKNQFLEFLKAQIQKIDIPDPEEKRRTIHRFTRLIDNELSQKDYWEEFQLTFNQVHQDFVHKLHERHPDISANDSRLCCFIRMGFSNAEIASILNITVNGVEQSKYRLKKKLELGKDVSVNEYIVML